MEVIFASAKWFKCIAIVMITGLLNISYTHALETNLSKAQRYDQSHWYLLLGQVKFDPTTDAIASGEIDDSATLLKFGWEKQRANNFLYGLGLSGFFYSDNEGFDVRTQNTLTGRRENMSSTADAFNLYFETGYRFVLTPKLEFSVLGGAEIVMTSGRGVASCNDCPSEDIDIDSGLYVHPKLTYIFENKWTLSLDYGHYFSGDVQSSVGLSIGYSR